MADGTAFVVFPTALGDCAVAWNERGLAGVWLPQATTSGLRQRIRRRHPEAADTAPTGPSLEAVRAITSLLDGEASGCDALRIDDSDLPAFDRRVYAEARRIPHGRVVSYATMAGRVGEDASARAVGQSLGRNPFPLVVPCHRIIGAGGDLVGFSAPGGTSTKRRLLTLENARLDGDGDLFDPA